MRFRLLGIAALFVLSACGQNVTPSSPAPQPSSPYAAAPLIPNAPIVNSPIKHVVIIVQENRSFDNLFYQYPGADSVPPASIALHQVALEDGQDICHFHASFTAAYDGGKMDGWPNEDVCGITGSGYGPSGVSSYMYGYVERSEVQPYWNLAQRYTLADRMFQSNSGPSFPAHQYLIAGQSANAAEVPNSASVWGCDSPPGTTVQVLQPDGTETTGPFPCFNYATIANELDAASLPWMYYAPAVNASGGIWSAYDAVRSIRYGNDWNTNVVSPETQVLNDVAAGKLADVTWVTPSMPNSDHPLGKSNTGPDWVTSVVNAIGTSPFWNSTAIFIVWDDWGGWYDHVKPPQYDVMGLGFRVPFIVVSPYAKHGYVSHVQHEFGSILKFVEDNFNLPSLHEVDSRSDDLLDCFNFNQSVTPFTMIPTRHPASFFVHQMHVTGPNDPD
jgi:phospholipase C